MMQRYVVRRQSSLAAAKRILAQVDDETDSKPKRPRPTPTRKPKARQVARPSRSRTDDAASEEDFTPDDIDNKDDGHDMTEGPRPKRRKTEKLKKPSKSEAAKLHATLFGPSGAAELVNHHKDACALPSRAHATSYHRPLLLDHNDDDENDPGTGTGRDGRDGRDALLAWFDSISTTRGMPWRKAWIDPASIADPAELRRALEKRAYEVWISEIMLQQTRVAVVIDYWNRWIARWPTIQDLAAADPEHVLGAWRGLGYYSRATRIHEAAKFVVADDKLRGLMPADAAELEARVPGVGRYTAGAISAIVFGRAAPMVDGNVLRVLSRQLGVFGNVKTDKAVVDLLWAAAEALVKAVAAGTVGAAAAAGTDSHDYHHHQQAPASDRPGRWGQALMELGSTVCSPTKPNCGECPITSTCRAYAEGFLLAAAADARSKEDEEKAKRKMPKVTRDIEDVCTICEPFEEDVDDDGAVSGEYSAAAPKKPVKGTRGKKSAPGLTKQATLLAFIASNKNNAGTGEEYSDSSRKQAVLDAKALEIIVNHARKFPLKVVKKAVREEEALVCAIRRFSDGRLLIHRRPEKGLLAGLWELPSYTLPAGSSNTAASRKKDAQAYVSGLGLAVVGGGKGPPARRPRLRHVAELGSVPWLFSHLKLMMHVHFFEAEGAEDYVSSHDRHKWATVDEVEDESMGTGMRKCWAMVKERVY